MSGNMSDQHDPNARVRREFLRRLAVTSVAIPVIGGTSLAGEHKRKPKEKEAAS